MIDKVIDCAIFSKDETLFDNADYTHVISEVRKVKMIFKKDSRLISGYTSLISRNGIVFACRIYEDSSDNLAISFLEELSNRWKYMQKINNTYLLRILNDVKQGRTIKYNREFFGEPVERIPYQPCSGCNIS